MSDPTSQMSCVLVGSGINMYNLTHYSCQMSCVVVGSDINMYNLTHYSCQMSCVVVGSGINNTGHLTGIMCKIVHINAWSY
jgi:predicted TIM-barrel enzyme